MDKLESRIVNFGGDKILNSKLQLEVSITKKLIGVTYRKISSYLELLQDFLLHLIKDESKLESVSFQ